MNRDPVQENAGWPGWVQMVRDIAPLTPDEERDEFHTSTLQINAARKLPEYYEIGPKFISETTVTGLVEALEEIGKAHHAWENDEPFGMDTHHQREFETDLDFVDYMAEEARRALSSFKQNVAPNGGTNS